MVLKCNVKVYARGPSVVAITEKKIRLRLKSPICHSSDGTVECIVTTLPVRLMDKGHSTAQHSVAH